MKKAIFFLVLVLMFGQAIFVYTTHNSKIVTIKSIDHKITKNGDDIQDKYLVFTDNDGVFENTDSWFYFKWNSSDVQNSLVVGQKVKLNYYGWRIPFFSAYPNIISTQKVE